MQVSDVQIAYHVFLQHWDFKKIELIKQLKLLLLTNGNHVLGMCDVASGSMDMAICDPKFIFSAALLSGAGRIILGNNNTSSILKPSEKDINLTMALVFAGKTLGVEVLDHIIFSKEGYFSFRANDLIKSDSLQK